MILTFKVIRDIVTVHSHAKFCIRMSNSSTVRVLTDTHTYEDGTDFIPSNADTLGNNKSCGPYHEAKPT